MVEIRAFGWAGVSVILVVAMMPGALACYTPSQYAVIDGMASALNMSSLSLRMVFEAACGSTVNNTYLVSNTTVYVTNVTNVTIVNITNISSTNITLLNVTNISYDFNYTNLSWFFNDSARAVMENYTSWIDDKMKMPELIHSLVLIANSSTKIESIDALVAAAERRLGDKNSEWQDEVTKTLADYATRGDIALVQANVSEVKSIALAVRDRLDAKPWYYDYWWLLLIAAAAVLVAWKKGAFKSGGDSRQRAEYLAALKAAGARPEASRRHISSIDEPAGPSGTDDFKTQLAKAERIKKQANDMTKERLKRAADAIHEVSKKARD